MARNNEMMEALTAIAVDKGISEEIMLEALANALVTAYKRLPRAAEEALVEIDVETGDIKVIAQELDEEGQVVQVVAGHAEGLRPDPAQTAWLVILQRIREAERAKAQVRGVQRYVRATSSPASSSRPSALHAARSGSCRRR